MNNFKINILVWITTIFLNSCSRHIPDKSAATVIIANDSSEIIKNIDSTNADSHTLSKAELTKVYSQAIADYIKEVYKKDKTVFDTLFFGKRNYGQPDDFPNIDLPDIIENTKILLIDPELGKKLQKERKSRIYINMIGWVDKTKAEFIFVTFSNGFEHKFDVYNNYIHDDSQNEFIAEKSRIEVLILNKKRKADHFAIYENGKYVGNKPFN